jgi:hypothetical protein
VLPFVVVALAQPAAAQTGMESPLGVSGAGAADSYAGYTIFRCLGATQRKLAHELQASDTARFAYIAAIAAPIRLAAQQCVGERTLDSVPPAELIGLAQLYLAAGDTGRANAAVTRRLTLARTPSDRVAVLTEVAMANMAYRHIRWVGVTWALNQLKAIPGPDAARARIRIYNGAITSIMLQNQADDSVALRLAEEEIAAAKALDNAVETKKVVAMVSGVQANFAMMNGDSVLRNGVALTMRPLNGTVLIGSGVYPKPGKINIIVFGFNHASAIATRRLKAKYGDAIEFVFLEATQGNFQLKAPLTLEQEAAALTAYAANDLKLPGAVLLEQTRITRRPDPDGRLIRAVTLNRATYGALGGVIVVDGDGKIRTAYPFLAAFMEVRLERGIDRIMAQ